FALSDGMAARGPRSVRFSSVVVATLRPPRDPGERRRLRGPALLCRDGSVGDALGHGGRLVRERGSAQSVFLWPAAGGHGGWRDVDTVFPPWNVRGVRASGADSLRAENGPLRHAPAPCHGIHGAAVSGRNAERFGAPPRHDCGIAAVTRAESWTGEESYGCQGTPGTGEQSPARGGVRAAPDAGSALQVGTEAAAAHAAGPPRVHRMG